MASKKKKQKKARKKKYHLNIKKVSLDQLINQSKQFLDAGRARDAVSSLKLAIKKGAPTDDINPMLFRAYLLRESQLRQKGMNVEADSIHCQAATFMPTYDKLSDMDLIAFMKGASIEDLISTYNRYIGENSRSSAVEQYLAGQFLIHRQWDLLDNLDERVPLKKDAAPVFRAAELMHSGDWESALACLKPVSRISPFAPARMFCLAMVSFYNEDDSGMQRALSMIPEEFPIYRVVKKLKKNPADLACLWEGPVNTEKRVAEVLEHLKKKRFKDAASQLRSIAELICPDDFDRAIFHLLELVWRFTWDNTINDYEYFRFIKRLLPENQSELLTAKTEYFEFEQPLINTGQYLMHIDAEFPDREHARIAHALILLHAVEKIHKENFFVQSLRWDFELLGPALGITADKPDECLIEMTLKAIRLDPENRRSYELLANQPRYSRQIKNLVEEGLIQMLDYFPDDPFPCLELATIYYEKNAFRKAENILKEAMKRAPHDSRVIDRHVISLLISADNSIKKKKLHLASRDIEKADALSGKATLPLVVEKQILFQITEQGQLSLFDGKVVAGAGNVLSVIDRAVAHLSPFEQISTIAMLILDATGRFPEWDKKIFSELDRAFRHYAKSIKDLSSAHIVSLLKPLSKKVRPLTRSRHIAGVILYRCKNILKYVDDTDIIPVLDILVDADLFKPALDEIKRRIKNAGGRVKVLLEFYQVVILHLTEELFMDLKAFQKVKDKTPESDLESLRTSARRLAKHASGPLKSVLESFDFTMSAPSFGPMDDMTSPYDLFDDDFLMDDNEEYDEQDDLKDFFELLEAVKQNPGVFDQTVVKSQLDTIIKALEHFIVAMGLRGAPDFLISEIIKNMRKDSPDMAKTFSTLASLLDTEGINALSSEARAFLFGKA
ncbi:MAG: hypothetical protein LWX02_03615 [Deltaproteobacteria bacterium]|jgi:tetratricopeptide (TPR) repeat protein|nr:hypothetical protein [Deltaproteobacteria bacterium]MDL1986794.1 hypothetical protein [Deltaproteobacteria bacterium]